MLSVSLPQLKSVAHTSAQTIAVVDELRQLIDGEVRTDRHDRMLYATDASIYQVEPIGVVIPKHADDVRTTVQFAAMHNLPILPRGGGTSLAGQTVNQALVIDFSVHCNTLIDVDFDGRSASVEPGLVLDDLNRALAPHNLMFGPDVATSTHANLAGMIGNNSAGAHSILYGRTVDNLNSLDVLLADGTPLHLAEGQAMCDPMVMRLTRSIAGIIEPIAHIIRQRYPTITRRVNGYNLDMILDQIQRSDPHKYEHVNLAHLLCGSEGTLAVTMRAGLNLVPTPAVKGLAIVAFDDVDSALKAVAAILKTSPAAVELIDDVIINLASSNNEYRRYVELLPHLNGAIPGAVLYVEYFADTLSILTTRFDELKELHDHSRMLVHTDSQAMDAAWKLRKAGEPLLYGMIGRRKPITFIEDAAVQPARLVEFVSEIRALLSRHGTTASFYAHASVGCLHIRPMLALRDPDDRQTMQRIAEQTCDLVQTFNGALSGEHGDGRLRSHLLERFYGPEIYQTFRQIKTLFDPHNRLNPGNIVSPQPMTEQLRVRPEDHNVVVHDVDESSTYYRYRAEGDLAEAVTMCNGAGVCRKTTAGTMCPSYRALRDERHCTRGRGNALRLALTGQLNTTSSNNNPNWSDPQTLATLDLCLSCKACKSECPSNVDIARLKAEYLAQGYVDGRAVPLNAKLFSHVRTLNKIGSAIYPLANVLMRSPLRALANNILHLDARRSLPEYGPSLLRWYNNRTPKNPDALTVLLFADCFTTYNEPHIGRAAVRVLEALGYGVVVADAGCCGRPMISLGLLDKAIAQSSATADALIEMMKQHNAVAVVNLEPSCHSAFVDDWRDLRVNVDQPKLHALLDRTYCIEDFIEHHWDEHPQHPQPCVDLHSKVISQVLLHGHCHQKALWGVEQTTALVKRCAGEQLEVLDSGCCGMAGAFGYTADHYDLSMAVGETALFPLVRNKPEATILAPGTSCRHQLRDALGRPAVHPIEYIAERMI